MTQRQIKLFWGTIGGALFGWMFGQLNVVWAWLYETELWKIVYQGSRAYNADSPPATVRMFQNPNATLVFCVFIGIALGFLVVYTLTLDQAGEK